MKIKNELPSITFILIPFFYLFYVWNKIPDKIPVQWVEYGESGQFEDKTIILLIPILLPLITYLTFLVVPNIKTVFTTCPMKKKYQRLKNLLTFFMSALAMFIIYPVGSDFASHSLSTITLLGNMYLMLGSTIKILGYKFFIKSDIPWTMENETAWNDSGILGERLLLVGGFIISCVILIRILNVDMFTSATVVSVIFLFFKYINPKWAR